MRGVKWTGESEERAKASTSELCYHVYAKIIVTGAFRWYAAVEYSRHHLSGREQWGLERREQTEAAPGLASRADERQKNMTEVGSVKSRASPDDAPTESGRCEEGPATVSREPEAYATRGDLFATLAASLGGRRTGELEDDDLRGPRASLSSLQTPIFVSQEGRGAGLLGTSVGTDSPIHGLKQINVHQLSQSTDPGTSGKRNLDGVIGTIRLVDVRACGYCNQS